MPQNLNIHNIHGSVHEFFPDSQFAIRTFKNALLIYRHSMIIKIKIQN